ncbi:MAG: aminotransferase class I/II-fold pyridoxal phosphate-dependent enzyme [Bacteroidia bacterium]|nr:aminotransferase class I/II-fold pyridoxal phosphate-dependent enzyme [Bacteroidia bacterium]
MHFPGSIHSKLPNVGTTIFTVMSRLAAEHNAINLSQGFPDFEGHPELMKLVYGYMKKGFNQYSPMAGAIPLREAIAAKTEEEYGGIYHPDTEITVTAGATQAIFTALAAFVQEDDEVIVFEPAYDCYAPAIELCGGKTLFVPLTFPGYRIDWDQVKKLVNHRTRMIIINTPHNPSGSVMDAQDMSMLQKITSGTDILILSDEVYEHIIFDGIRHESVIRYPALAERSFVVSSFGKTYHATGWKTGYVVAPANLMAEFRKVHQFNVFAVNTPVQLGIAEFMKRKEHYRELGTFYQEKRDKFISLIRRSRFNFEPALGTYFQLLGYENMTSEKDADFAIRLTREFRIASIPVSVFYHTPQDNHMLRFCFAKKDETLEAAARILNTV